jgi:hypothetical protein
MTLPSIIASAVAGAPTLKSATVALCWCESTLAELVANGTIGARMKHGATGDDVALLHEHLKRFGFETELTDHSKPAKPVATDIDGKSWGKRTDRAVRMFGLHPQVDAETEIVVKADGQSLTAPLVSKIALWCRNKVQSPANYWEFKGLNLDAKTQAVDAFGADADSKAVQSAWHHHVRQVQEDFARTGFSMHDSSECKALCEISKAAVIDGHFRQVPANATDDIAKNLRDLAYLTAKLQRQAGWLWRMDKAGKHLPDAAAGDATHYSGTADGVMNQETAKVLHAWAENGLHVVMKKFELMDLHWPPESATRLVNSPTTASAQLRRDAYDQWLVAAKSIHAKGATIEGPYASTPRGWKGGKGKAGGGSSQYSWHYSALGFDLNQAPAPGDTTMGGRFRYALEEEVDRFRIWCWALPQTTAPASSADDKADKYVQYRNRNIKVKMDIATASASSLVKDPKKASEIDAAPLAHMCSDHVARTVKEGWYVDITRILEEAGLMRIPRHKNWQTDDKGWEWWHYQYSPAPPPGASSDLVFGDYLQLYGVHEYHLRALPSGTGWSSHNDINHTPG